MMMVNSKMQIVMKDNLQPMSTGPQNGSGPLLHLCIWVPRLVYDRRNTRTQFGLDGP